MKRHAPAAGLLLLCGPLHAVVDTDADGIDDIQDNCANVANADQRDSDGDLFGNRCDADLNNDGVVGFADLAQLKIDFFASGDLASDLDGDGAVGFGDLAIMKDSFFAAPGPSGAAASAASVVLTRVFPSLPVSGPIFMAQAPGDDGSWYVAERDGRIVRFDNVANPTTVQPVLDIRDRVDTFFEGGLLGFAFDPQFQRNGRLYVSYTATGQSVTTNPLDSRVSLFTPDAADPDVFDADLEQIVIEVDQPFGNHNGGMIAFGPDGYLYYALGDGGSGGDPGNNGQDETTLLGAMLRLDVSAGDGSYAIPPTNPNAASPGCGIASNCPELFAWGLRNTWRFSFDRLTGDLLAGDVGQGAREELDLIVLGGNYGWRCYEASLPFNTTGCGPLSGFEAPLYEYPRSDGRSVTGGYVSRGLRLTALNGVYIYGDFASGRIWGLLNGNYLGEYVDSGLSLASFAEANNGDLYALDLFSNAIYRIDLL